ncbi:hypothetical protein MNBD_NITROSPIRAE01-342 [hydrothermal vent metagenome]|uniref:Uncharacterized protein n=1 Tax=hydrothermal vent metagenome TaxID=652676 RepID=A0A3B1D8B3_9ZZZZ
MNSHTETVTIKAKWKSVYDFLANTANLPKWAVCFCQNIRHDGNHWIATTPGGEIKIRYDCDAKRGLIDMYDVSNTQHGNPAFTRLVPNGPEETEYIFTFFQSSEIPDAIFAEQIKGLKTEFGVLKTLMEK